MSFYEETAAYWGAMALTVDGALAHLDRIHDVLHQEEETQ